MITTRYCSKIQKRNTFKTPQRCSIFTLSLIIDIKDFKLGLFTTWYFLEVFTFEFFKWIKCSILVIIKRWDVTLFVKGWNYFCSTHWQLKLFERFFTCKKVRLNPSFRALACIAFFYYSEDLSAAACDTIRKLFIDSKAYNTAVNIIKRLFIVHFSKLVVLCPNKFLSISCYKWN